MRGPLHIGALQIKERFSTLLFKSIHRDLRTVGGRFGPLLKIANFYFSEGLVGRGEGGG